MSITPVEISKSIASGAFQPNTYLTNLSLASFQSDDDFAATKLFPIVPVALPVGRYFKFTAADLARDSVQLKPAFGRAQPALMGLAGRWLRLPGGAADNRHRSAQLVAVFQSGRAGRG